MRLRVRARMCVRVCTREMFVYSCACAYLLCCVCNVRLCVYCPRARARVCNVHKCSNMRMFVRACVSFLRDDHILFPPRCSGAYSFSSPIN